MFLVALPARAVRTLPRNVLVTCLPWIESDSRPAIQRRDRITTNRITSYNVCYTKLLRAFLAARAPARDAPPAEHERPRFSFVHVLYYLGGMIAIGAMSLFMTISWASYGPWSGVVFSVAYGVLFIALTHVFYERKRLAVPAGIMATLAVVMA